MAGARKGKREGKSGRATRGEKEKEARSDEATVQFPLAYVAGARKGKGEGKSDARDAKRKRKLPFPFPLGSRASDLPSPFLFLAPATQASGNGTVLHHFLLVL